MAKKEKILVNMVEDNGELKTVTENVEVIATIPEPQPIIPTRSDLGWTAYVMSKFDPSELEKGCPKINGLRRVTELLIGRIVGIRNKVVDTNDLRTTCVTNLEIQERATQEQLDRYDSATTLYFDGTADACRQNTDPPYSSYLPQMAETRARARAFKNALGIDIVSAEETSQAAEAESIVIETNQTAKIVDTQANCMNIICKRLNIDVKKFVNSGSKVYNRLNDIAYETAGAMVAGLNKYQQNMDIIPDVMKGYKEDWQKDFYKAN